MTSFYTDMNLFRDNWIEENKEIKKQSVWFCEKKERFSEQICQKGNNEREVEGFNLFFVCQILVYKWWKRRKR